MITADVARMVLVAAMALPGMPLWAMVVLLFSGHHVQRPLPGRPVRAPRRPSCPATGYALGLAIFQVTREIGVVGGFVAGGFIVSALRPRTALADRRGDLRHIRAACLGGRATPPRTRTPPGIAPGGGGGRAAPRVRRTYRLRALMLLGWLAAFYTVAEALAVPYAAQLRHGPVAAGLIFAAGPLGSAVGMVVFTRLVSPATRLRWMSPMAVAACLVLLACLARPGLLLLLVILTVSGLLAAYQIAANAGFVMAAPDDRRGQAYAIANGGMMLGQGLVYVLAGAAATLAAPAPAIVVAGSGAIGAAFAIWLVVAWRHKAVVTPERG